MDRSCGYIYTDTCLPCSPIEINIDKISCYEYIKENVEKNARYQLVYYNTTGNSTLVNGSGHVVSFETDNSKNIRLYDPQDGQIVLSGNLKLYLDAWTNSPSKTGKPFIIRVDDKQFNPKYIQKVVKPRKY